MQDREYLTVMIQSLEKKKSILDRIIEKNREQRVLFTEEDSDPEILEQNMQEKSSMVDQLNQLDEGFQQVYDRVKPLLQQDKETYREEIKSMKQLITEITERSTTVQAQERRNYDLAVKRFASVKENIRQARTSKPVLSEHVADECRRFSFYGQQKVKA